MLLQLLEGHARGFLLGTFLGGSGALRGDWRQLRRSRDDHFDQEALAMVRPGLRLYLIFRRRAPLACSISCSADL